MSIADWRLQIADLVSGDWPVAIDGDGWELGAFSATLQTSATIENRHSAIAD
jgi:hypothetical protein